MTRTTLFFGLALIALGILLLLDQAGSVDSWSVLADWWPSLVILAGLAQITTRPHNVTGGLLLAAVGGVLLLWTVGPLTGIGLLWPVLLIVLGAWLIVGRAGSGGRSADGTTLSALFDDRHARPTGPFSGGEITTLFGDAELDLRFVEPSAEEVPLQVTTIFGDVDLVIPATWDIRVSGPEIFGDVALEGATRRGDPETVLRLQVFTIFGDIGIRTVPVRSADTAVGSSG
jgi:hypothetical protein